MSDAAIFVAAFLGLFVLRVALATLVFFWILPRSDRCPDCNAVTIRLEPAEVVAALEPVPLVPLQLVPALRVARRPALPGATVACTGGAHRPAFHASLTAGASRRRIDHRVSAISDSQGGQLPLSSK